MFDLTRFARCARSLVRPSSGGAACGRTVHRWSTGGAGSTSRRGLRREPLPPTPARTLRMEVAGDGRAH